MSKHTLLFPKLSKSYVSQIVVQYLNPIKDFYFRWTREEGGGGITCVIQVLKQLGFRDWTIL